jgi:hypothetical protein
MIFDRFECAIQAMAPVCAHCGRNVIGRGIEVGGQMFCSESCGTGADRPGLAG